MHLYCQVYQLWSWYYMLAKTINLVTMQPRVMDRLSIMQSCKMI